jgi:hypothetical protein
MSLEQFGAAAEVLDRSTDSLRYRMWTEFAEAHGLLLERDTFPERSPSNEELAGLYLRGIRQTIFDLMYGCDLAYRALGLSEPFSTYFDYVEAPAVVRRQVRRLLGDEELPGEQAPVQEKDEPPSNAGGDSPGGLPECN